MKSWHFSLILVATALTALGLFLAPKLQFNFFSNNNPRSFGISYYYPNATAEMVEHEITAPLEAALSLSPGINTIKSVISRGYGNTQIEIDDHYDMDHLRFEVAQKIRQVYPSLPDQVTYPHITAHNPDQKDIDPTLMSYTLAAPEDRSILFDYSREILIPQMASIGGVYEVRMEGAMARDYVLSYEPKKLQHLGIHIDDINHYISTGLRHKGLSYINDSYYWRYAAVDGAKLEQLMESRFTVPHGRDPVFINDLLTLEEREQKPRRYYRINGQNSVILNFIAEQDANHLQTAQNIRQAVRNINKTLPSGYSLRISYDTTDHISEELNKIKYRTLWSVGILIILIILIYRRMKMTMLLLFSLLVSMSTASIFYHLFDIQLDLYALAAITISFGIIVDNIIVVAHHYQKHQNIKVASSLITATLTTLSALLILLFLPEKMLWELGNFAKVMAINLLVSLPVSIFLVPALIEKWQIEQSKNRNHYRKIYYRVNSLYKKYILWSWRWRKLIIIGVILLFGLPTFWLPANVQGWHWYNKSIGSETYQENIKPWANKILGGSLRLFSQYVYEGSAYRSPEETMLYVNASMPPGSTALQMNELIQKLEDYLSNYTDEIKTYVTQIVSGQSAQIKISFPHDGEIGFPYMLKNRLQSTAIDLGGVQWDIYGVGRGFSNAGASNPPRFRIMMKGYHRQNLKSWAAKFSDLLLKHPRIQSVNLEANINWWEKDQYEYQLDIDKKNLTNHQWTLNDINNLLAEYNQEARMMTYTRDNKIIRINSKYENKNLWSLTNSQQSNGNNSIMLASIADIEKKKISNSIHKEDQQYLQLMEFEYTGSVRFGQKYLDQCMAEFNEQIPLGYSLEQYDFSWWGNQQKKQYGLLLLVIMAIFFICSIHFESLHRSLTIIVLIPLSFIGIFLIFYWFDFPFDQGGYTSFLLVSGIVVNSLILIFSDYLRLKRKLPKRNTVDIYLRAFRQKITPITLTIISTAMGLLPFTFHGSQEVFWFSLAVGTIGGLVFSLLFLVLLLPPFIKI